MKSINSSDLISKDQLLKLIVGLIEVSDYSLIDSVALYKSEVCLSAERELVREIAKKIKILFDDFDYISSTEFVQLTKNRSKNFVKMKEKIESSPSKRKNNFLRFSKSVSNLLNNKDIEQLIGESQIDLLISIRNDFFNLSNP